MTALTESANGLTVEQARKLLQVDAESEMVVGHKWYIIDHRWWIDFANQVQESNLKDHVIKMRPISNQSLVLKNDNGHYILKQGLQPNVHIYIVSEPVFNELKNIYGLEIEERDAISRDVVKGTILQQKEFVEIYPLLIKVANYNNKEDVYTIPISQSDTIEKIRNTIMDKLDINEQDRKNTQFFIEENGQYEEIPETISHTKLSALLNSGTTVFVDSSGNVTQELTINNGSTRSGTRYSVTRNLSSAYQRGVCGLQNLGNTCFMNSALQCLSNVPELTEYFLNERYLLEINEQNPLGTGGRLVGAYAELLQEMWSGALNSVRPWKLKCVIGEFAPRFNGYAQQDSQELTAFLLDGLHEDLNRIKKKPYIEDKERDGYDDAKAAFDAWLDYKRRNDSIIVDLLHGQLKSTLTCNVCNKLSIKFDPFCFLSVPIPAKERQAKSMVIFVRKNKWAKFSITHTNKTTAKQIKQTLKEHLNLQDESQIVLLSFYGGDVVDDDQILVSPYNSYTNKQFYAFAISSGPFLLIENRSAQYLHQTLGLTFPINRPEKITRNFVMNEVLSKVKNYFWHEQEGASNIEDKVNGNQMDIVSEENLIAPSEILLKQPNAADLTFPDDLNKELPCPSSQDSPLLKILIKWTENKQFHAVNIDDLVDREVNLASNMKKIYSLKECIDLYTTREQLNEEDSWYCPRCKVHQRAFKKLDLWFLPKILIIHLKRFIYSRYTRDKIDTEIELPVRAFDLSDKILNPTHSQEKYDLIGISNHIGGLGGGHYTARALNSNNWCEFNDSSAYCLNASLPETIQSREAYMLVYRRRGNVDEPQLMTDPN